VVATLRLEGAQTTFKSGQPVRVILSFTGAAERYVVNSLVYPETPFPDRYIFTPADGVAKVYHEGYSPDYLTTRGITGEPIELRITLNEYFRFDKAGHYSLKIESSRVFVPSGPTALDLTRTPPVATNSVEFDIVPMTAEEEAQELRMKKQIAATRGAQAAEVEARKELTYLTGDVAARDAVTSALRGGANPSNLIHFSNHELVLRLLEEGYLRPDAPVSENILKDMVALHSPKDKADAVRILLGYLHALAGSLESKNERPRMVAAQAILMLASQNGWMESKELIEPAMAVVREHFEASNVELMLRVFWPQLRDPSLVPALERILPNPRLQSRGNGPERGEVLKALFDLAPERATPFVVDELQNPQGLRDVKLLGQIPDAELPDLDAVLLARLHGSGAALDGDTRVLARFASAAILPDVLKLYASPPADWNPGERMHVLAYLARREGDAVLPAIRAEVERDLREHGTASNVMGGIVDCYFSDVVARLLREQLAGEDSQSASWAAYYLSTFGDREDRARLEARLSRTPETDTRLVRELTDGLAKLRSRFPE